MKSSSSSTAVRNSNNNHPPLAHDEQGHPVAMPDGAAWWAIKRHTTGRPKAILGPDRRPVRLPLDTTEEEIADTFGPGIYRFDALDEVGNQLDHVTTLEIGLDDSDDEDDERDRSLGARGRGGSTDLRFALETIMQMARAQSDSLRAVTEAQADWVKGLANAKALPRNGVYVPPLALPAPAEVDKDDEDDEEEEEEPATSPWAQAAQGIIHDLSPAVAAFVSTLGLRNAAAPIPAAPAASPAPAAPSAPNPMVHLAEINERLTGSERRVLRTVLRNPNAEVLTNELLALSVDDAAAFVQELIARGRAPATPREADAADFTAHAAAIAALLSPEERAVLLPLLPRLRVERREMLQAQLLAMSADDAAAWIRENLPAIHAEVES